MGYVNKNWGLKSRDTVPLNKKTVSNINFLTGWITFLCKTTIFLSLISEICLVFQVFETLSQGAEGVPAVVTSLQIKQLSEKDQITASLITFLSVPGTRPHCRDNVTIFSGHKVVGYGILAILYSLWLLHLDTETLTFFEFCVVSEALLRCRVVVFTKLKNCRVPSSAFLKPKCYKMKDSLQLREQIGLWSMTDFIQKIFISRKLSDFQTEFHKMKDSFLLRERPSKIFCSG